MIDLNTVLPVLVALLAILGPLFWFGHKIGVLDTQMTGLQEDIKGLRHDLDVARDAMWLRANAELVNKGKATMNSPIHLGKATVEAMLPFIALFIPFYLDMKHTNPAITDKEMFWKLEEKFGEEVMEKVCIAQGLDQLGCLVAILEICKQQEAQDGTT